DVSCRYASGPGTPLMARRFSDFSTSAMSGRLEFTLRRRGCSCQDAADSKRLTKSGGFRRYTRTCGRLNLHTSEAQEALGIKDERAPPGRPRKDLEWLRKNPLRRVFLLSAK